MDLISRKEAVTRISDLLILELKGQRIPTWNEVYNAIGDIPSVPAVPLDKLCEWLADNYEPPANVSNGKALDDHEFCVTLWRYALEKLMEEQDATDKC